MYVPFSVGHFWLSIVSKFIHIVVPSSGLFFWLFSVYLFIYIYLAILLLMGIWVFSSWELLQALLGIFWYVAFGE